MTNETGHAKNVANFEDMISFVTGYGVTYNPSKNEITLPQLNALLSNAKNSLTNTNAALVLLNNAKNARDIAFAPLSKLTTRIFAALDATNASKQMVKGAKTICRKLQGKRAEKIPTPTPPTTPTATTALTILPPVPAQTISASQMGFDNRIENFSKLILLLTGEPLYIPNETDVKLITLNALLTTLKTTNTAVIDSTTIASNARINRNKILYLPATGMCDIQAEVKKYIKSVFGATSPQYKQISGIKFTKAR
jgi:hypothetical protein